MLPEKSKFTNSLKARVIPQNGQGIPNKLSIIQELSGDLENKVSGKSLYKMSTGEKIIEKNARQINVNRIPLIFQAS